MRLYLPLLYLALGFVVLASCQQSAPAESSTQRISQPNQDKSTQTVVKPVELLIDGLGKGQNPLRFSVEHVENMTVLDLLEQGCQQGSIELGKTGDGPSAFVKSIGGISGSSDQGWLYYVNDEMGNVGSDVRQLMPGDKVEWRLGSFD